MAIFFYFLQKLKPHSLKFPQQLQAEMKYMLIKKVFIVCSLHALTVHFNLPIEAERWKISLFFVDSVPEKDNVVSSFYQIKIGQELRDMGQVRICSSNVASVAMEYAMMLG